MTLSVQNQSESSSILFVPDLTKIQNQSPIHIDSIQPCMSTVIADHFIVALSTCSIDMQYVCV